MLRASGDTPWWLDWVLPVVAGTTALGGLLIWLGRVMLLPGIKQELEELLQEKFQQAHDEMQQRHEENQDDIEQLRKLLDQSADERRKLQSQLIEILADVSYLKGRAGGNIGSYKK